MNSLAGPDDEVTILDIEKSIVTDRAKELDIRSIPCVVIDGEVPDCCQKGFPYEWEPLKAAGLGQPLSKNWKDFFIKHALLFSPQVFSSWWLAFINGKAYIKKHLTIYQRSSALSISEYKEVSYSDEMGIKIL